MSGKPSNTDRKKIIGDAIKAQKARFQASIDACNEQKRVREEQRAILHQTRENDRLQRLYNLNKTMVVVFVELGDTLVILTIVDLSLIKCHSTTRQNHHIVYGNTEYKTLSMMASHNPSGTRRENTYFESYTVSTLNGSEFNVVDKNGEKVFSFETFMKYESLTEKTFSDVKFDQWLYSPSNVESDEKTAMFHPELVRLIKEDEDYLKKNTELRQDGYVPYHLSRYV